MPETAPTYDLMLLLSEAVPDEERTRLLGEVESAIGGGGGEVVRRDSWGRRPLTFRINHQREADYHLLQFTGPPSLLETLQHNLHIADGVLRFRIIKVIPGTPSAPDSPPPVVGAAPAPAPAPAEGRSEARPAAPAEPPAAAPAEV